MQVLILMYSDSDDGPRKQATTPWPAMILLMLFTADMATAASLPVDPAVNTGYTHTDVVLLVLYISCWRWFFPSSAAWPKRSF